MNDTTRNERQRQLSSQCGFVERFLMNFPDGEGYTDNVGTKPEFCLFQSEIKAIKKALRLGLAEMAKEID